MTTTVRSVRVELEASVGGYIRDMKLAGSETDRAFSGIESRISGTDRAIGGLEKSTQSLSKTSTQAKTTQAGLSREVEKTSAAASKGERSIDKFSGRLRLLTDIALIGGPALLRLGAGALPAVSAGLVGIAATAGGIGVTVAAVSGLKDGLKALNDYELERTPENLTKLRQEFARLGPDGAHFVQYLRDLGPELQHLQMLARAGVLPGFEAGIDSLITRLPIIEQIVNRLAREVGVLSSDAGDAIASDRLTPFLEYIRETGAPTLDAFARSAGNVALGLANILVAFDPATQDAIDGMVSGTERFARATEHLDENERFQAFLSEVREAGPQVIDFLGSAVDLMIGLARASAPFGRVALPGLTAIAKGFAAIANSPIGGPLYTAAAAILLFNRAASVGAKATTSLASGLDSLGTKATTTKAKLSLLTARGGVILAGAAAVGALADNINRIDPSNLDRSLTALNFGDVTDDIDKVIDSIGGLESKWNKVDLGKVVTVGGLLGASTSDRWKDNIDQVDKSLANLVESGNADQAAELFQKISDLAEAKGVDPAATAKRFDAYALALENVANAEGQADTRAGLFGSALSGLEGDLQGAIDAASDLTDEIAILNGYFDKRDALRGYKDSVLALTQGLKDGFKREDAANIDAVGGSILQVAEQIQNPTRRAAFLESARAQLEDLAQHKGPEAAAAIQKLINKFDSQGLTHPEPIKLTVDQKSAEAAFAKTRRSMASLDNTTATPTVQVNPGNTFTLLGGIQSALSKIVSKTITVTVKKVGNALGGFGIAEGGTVPGERAPYGDKVHAMLAPGEEVISNRHGQADQFRADRAAGRIPGYADGGYVRGRGSNDPLFTSEGPRFYKAAYRHNKPFAIDPSDSAWPYQTGLTSAQNRAFEKWVNDWDIPFDLAARTVDYDMRGFYKKARPKRWTAGQHFPDTFKTPYDTTFSHESKYATSDNPFYWHGDKLIDERTGQVVFASGSERRGYTGNGARNQAAGVVHKGEFVVDAEDTRRDRDLLESRYGRLKGYADGGLVGSTYTSRGGRDLGFVPDTDSDAASAFHQVASEATGAATALKGLNKQAARLEKSQDAAQTARDAVRSHRDSVASTTTGLLTSDLFQTQDASDNPWAPGAHGAGLEDPFAVLQSDITQATLYDQLVQQLKSRGLGKAAIEEVASHGLPALQQVAGYSDQDLQRFEQLYSQRAQVVGTAAADTAQAVIGNELKSANKHLEKIDDRLHEVNLSIKHLEAEAKKNSDDNAHKVADGVNSAGDRGDRNRVYAN